MHSFLATSSAQTRLSIQVHAPLGPPRAGHRSSLWRLIHDGKVQGIESYYGFVEEEDEFKEDMERAFEYHGTLYCHDTVALQGTWNEQEGALTGNGWYC